MLKEVSWIIKPGGIFAFTTFTQTSEKVENAVHHNSTSSPVDAGGLNETMSEIVTVKWERYIL